MSCRRNVSLSISILLVPTLRVGTQVRTLCVPSTNLQSPPPWTAKLNEQRRQAVARDGTRSVQTCVPTRSVGTRWAPSPVEPHERRPDVVEPLLNARATPHHAAHLQRFLLQLHRERN